MFTQDQKDALKADLDKSAVKTRQKGGSTLSYIEAWHAIYEANRIFGFENWTRETVYCKEVCRYKYRDKNKVGYEAMVRVTAVTPDGIRIVREGTGHGSGIGSDLFDCIEGAAKEAETDAMKRALMTFGSPFGLALYDKEQKNVSKTPPQKVEGGAISLTGKKGQKAPPTSDYTQWSKVEWQQWIKSVRDHIETLSTEKELDALLLQIAEKQSALLEVSKAGANAIEEAIDAKKFQLKSEMINA